ncbi:hypothetical protein E4U42_004654 [Claviceps africana]|uniref:Uncharacterized protein n=1 Tax=Claviceps africana TaxID=83212 RepID=A0A8K0JB12_9HYPO|nr:hypothetical protein E4U42_004654 [Claviceps africana]
MLHSTNRQSALAGPDLPTTCRGCQFDDCEVHTSQLQAGVERNIVVLPALIDAQNNSREALAKVPKFQTIRRRRFQGRMNDERRTTNEDDAAASSDNVGREVGHYVYMAIQCYVSHSIVEFRGQNCLIVSKRKDEAQGVLLLLSLGHKRGLSLSLALRVAALATLATTLAQPSSSARARVVGKSSTPLTLGPQFPDITHEAGALAEALAV